MWDWLIGLAAAGLLLSGVVSVGRPRVRVSFRSRGRRR